jgi:hypothetical protein
LDYKAAEMKRRIIKKVLRTEEQNLRRSLEGFLANTNIETQGIWLRELNSALTYLLGVQLQLDPSWDHKERWIDDVEWSSLSSSVTTLKGKGKIWWGYRKRTSAALVAVEFEARLQLQPTVRSFGLGYVVTFEDQGIRFCIYSSGHRC